MTTAKQAALVWACVGNKDSDRMKKCIEYEVEGARPRGGPASFGQLI